MNFFKINFADFINIIFKIIINIPKMYYMKLKLYFLIYRKPKIIIKNDTRYRDLYKNGKIEVYENKNLTSEQRADDLLKKMNIEEKVGQMFHPPLSINSSSISQIMNLASGKGDSIKSLILNKSITHFNLYGSPSPIQLAKKLNKLQKIAERSRLGIPLTISSDPIHEVPKGGGIAAFSLKGFSKWPSQLGFASTREPEAIKEFAEIAREEYLAVGLRTALHPMSDLATEPRWARNFGTFGSNADLSSDLTIAYMEGFQGKKINSNSVLTMVKHFPGGGPQEDGLDPHLYSGRNQIYPGNNFEYHLKPFKKAIKNNLKVIMPYYGIAIDQTSENVAMAYNKDILTHLLRDQLGYEGVICTDWGVITGRHWGVDSLNLRERYKKSIEAGVDQYGGESSPELIVALVKNNEISEKRINYSVKKILINKFDLGLFDNPFVDEDCVKYKVGTAENLRKGLVAQKKSIVLLKNEIFQNNTVLPLEKNIKIFADGFEKDVFKEYCKVTDNPTDADYIIVQLKTVFNGNQPSGIDRPIDNFLSTLFPNNDLNYDDKIMKKLKKYSLMSKLIIVVDLNRPAILTEIEKLSHGLIGVFGVFDKIVVEVIFGDFNPTGKLPFDIPSSMKEVNEQFSDVPDDTRNPIFRYGHGLGYLKE